MTEIFFAENGGHLCFSDDWPRLVIYKVTKDEKTMVSRLGNTAAKPIAPAIRSEKKLDLQHKIKRAEEEYESPAMAL